jgi:NTP pyrophosphatase (non-canonical NTP hydrolase)
MKEVQFNEISAWQKQTFGQATPLSKIAHLAEELEELVEDLKSKNPERRLEFADCFFLLFGAAAAYGMTYQDICNAIQEKFEINKARKWGIPDENGVVKHIKS